MLFDTGQRKLQTEVLQLRRALEELSILNELARAISSSLGKDEILATVIRHSARAVAAEQALITLVDEDEMSPAGTLIRTPSPEQSDHFHLTRNLLGCMCHQRQSLMVNDVKRDPELGQLDLPPNLRHLLCVPLYVEGHLIGVLSACNKIGAPGFDDDDLKLLAIIAAQSAQVLERSRLREEEQQSQLMRQEIQLAGHIQNGLVPSEDPDMPGYDLSGLTRPASETGGDYFDFVALDNHRWGLALGDVSGKGIPAALLMANLQATLRGQAFQNLPVHECLRHCNRLLFRSTPPEKFATLFYGVLNVRSHVLTYCNAGQDPPIFLSPGGHSQRLKTGGLALGVLEDWDYRDDIVHFNPGDRLVIYSDGVPDTENADGDYFGEDLLMDSLGELEGRSSAAVVTSLQRRLALFANNHPPVDDVTMMVLQRVVT